MNNFCVVYICVYICVSIYASIYASRRNAKKLIKEYWTLTIYKYFLSRAFMAFNCVYDNFCHIECVNILLMYKVQHK